MLAGGMLTSDEAANNGLVEDGMMSRNDARNPRIMMYSQDGFGLGPLKQPSPKMVGKLVSAHLNSRHPKFWYMVSAHLSSWYQKFRTSCRLLKWADTINRQVIGVDRLMWADTIYMFIVSASKLFWPPALLVSALSYQLTQFKIPRCNHKPFF